MSADKWPVEEVELTYEERRKFGECPACQAPHGRACYPEVGFRMGAMSPEAAAEGVHLGRLQQAPTVRVVSYR